MCYDIGYGREAAGMTIKKRLFCSNILMIAVPAAIVALVGLLCMALLWLTLQSGSIMRSRIWAGTWPVSFRAGSTKPRTRGPAG